MEGIHIKGIQNPKDQRDDGTNQAQPITRCCKLLFHLISSPSYRNLAVFAGTLLPANHRVKRAKRSAKRRASRNSRFGMAEKTYTGALIITLTEALGTSLVAQAIDGVEVGGHVCRIIAEEQAHADGDHETNGHPQIRQRCGNRRDESPHQCGYAGAD